MKIVSWGLAVIMMVVGLGWLGLVAVVWLHRKKFELAARSPPLVCISEIAALLLVLSVLLHWLLLLEGDSLPCYGIFWTSYCAYALCDSPYLIRAARLIVAYNKEYRYKYAQFVKWTPMMVVWAVTTIGLAIRAALFFGERPGHRSSDARDCFYFDDILLLGLVVVFVGGPAIFLARTLSKVNDAFKIRQELERVIVICSLFGGTMTTIQVLVILDVLPDSRQVHVVVETFALLFGANVGIWGLLVPLATLSKLFGSKGQRVYPDGECSPGKSTVQLDGVLEFARKGEATGQRFGEFCRANLCMESWDFIVEAVQYETLPEDIDSQFSTFLHILNQYCLPTSPDEVNISSSMSKRIASWKTRDAFGSLDGDKRRDILKDPLDEIVRMLEQNLLTKFRQRELQQQEMQLAEAAKGDKELMKLMSCSSANSA